ncbi:MAG TPA: response regulator transcription factor [Chloroflexota bacterium]|nr:response regulator transcription factor [Chloroflexota bacterium]
MQVAVVAPYPALRAGLRAMLAAEGLAVVREAASLDHLVGAVADAPFDLAVVDPGPGAEVDGLTDALGDAPSLRLLVLGPVTGAERLPAALDDRPWGYVPRESDGEALAAAARAVAAGLVAIEPRLAGRLVQPRTAPSPPDRDGSVEELSPRERQVLELVARGLANKQIAQRLRISEHTAKFHVAAILAKLGAQSRTEAVHLAARRGLIAL